MASHEGIEAVKKKEAAARAAATERKGVTKQAYQKAALLSSLKILIGGLLLFGDENQKAFWPFFEATLRQYVDLRLACQSKPETREPANAGQRVS